MQNDSRINTIIFDAEGVVVDTEEVWDKGQEEFLRRRGFVYERERIKPLLTGRSLVEGVEVMKREYGIDGDADALARERAEIVRDVFEGDVGFVPGFLEFFESVRTKYKTCIATAMEKGLLALIDHRLGLSKLFEGKIFTLDDVDHRSKPNPDLFLYAAEQLRSVPAYCVVIEDAPYGVEAAKRAGMKCIAITTTYDHERLCAADLIVDAYSEIDLANW